jgi:hypothetical protein
LTFSFIAMRANAWPSDPSYDRRGDGDSVDPAAAVPHACESDSAPAAVPRWWCSRSGIGQLLDELDARGYHVVHTLKVSSRSAVMLSTTSKSCSADLVVVKLYCARPTLALEAMQRAMEIAAGMPAGSALLEVLDEVPTSVGHCVVFSRVAPPPVPEQLSIEVRRRLADCLEQLLDYWHAHQLYHGDLHIENVSFDAKSETLALVDIDACRWFNSTSQLAGATLAEWKGRDKEGLDVVKVQLRLPEYCVF